MPIKTIFLDRDGVINKEKNYLHKIEDFEFIKGVFDACKHFNNLDFKIIIITNQSGIARGFYSKNDYKILTQWMKNQLMENGVNILDVFYCPHLPKDKCWCRKPSPGMLIDAQEKYNIEMKKSWLIGDKEDDIIAANKAGIFNTILVKSGHKIDKSPSKAKFILDSIVDSKTIII
jgi:D-glycero-D-manno-heptose 1,7-bisphosphate phosphatase